MPVRCAQVVADALPGLSHLNIGVQNETLTDELLGMVLSMGPHLRNLGVQEIELSSDAHSTDVWPW